MSGGTVLPADSGWVAEEALTGGRFVKVGTTSERGVDMCDTQGEACLGAIKFDVVTGDSVPVYSHGDVLMESGGVVNIGDDVTPGADGRVEAAAVADIIAGQAKTAATGAGQKIWVFVNPTRVAA